MEFRPAPEGIGALIVEVVANTAIDILNSRGYVVSQFGGRKAEIVRVSRPRGLLLVEFSLTLQCGPAA